MPQNLCTNHSVRESLLPMLLPMHTLCFKCFSPSHMHCIVKYFYYDDYLMISFCIYLLCNQDPKEGNWWMQFGREYVLGYWPSFLFSYLADSASMIEWGGEVVNSEPDGTHTSTQMGSGHFPEEGFGKASYFKNIHVVDSSNQLSAPKGMGTFTEQSNCYDVQNGNNGD
jgi:hypothetical protein